MKPPARTAHCQLVRPAAALLLGMSVCIAAANAAEIGLRSECRPEAPLVTLGDLADIRSEATETRQRLAGIVLFPTPAPGLERRVSAREIQDMLLIRDIPLLDHEFRGAATVVVRGSEPAPEVTPSVILEAAAPAKAQRRLQEALQAYLRSWADEPWQAEFQLDPVAAKWIAAADQLSVASETPPAVGKHSFQISLHVGQLQRSLALEAELSLPPLVVVASYSLPRSGIIGPADIELRRISGLENSRAYPRRLEDVIGKQASRALAAGKPIERGWIQAPVLVRRGEIVTVYARAAGISVRTKARARDDGAQGDLVLVESITDRKSFLAHVSGLQEVEILGSGVAVADAGRSRPTMAE